MLAKNFAYFNNIEIFITVSSLSMSNGVVVSNSTSNNTGVDQVSETVHNNTPAAKPMPKKSSREEFADLCKVNDQLPRDIPLPDEEITQKKKSNHKIVEICFLNVTHKKYFITESKLQDFNSKLLEILKDPACKTPTGMQRFCNQVAEMFLLIIYIIYYYFIYY